jgi:hypothetical protein
LSKKGVVTDDRQHLSRLYEIAAFERPLTDVERLDAGLGAQLDAAHVACLWERAALEGPLGERALHELELDLRAA